MFVVGPLDDLPDGQCVAVGDGSVAVVRTGSVAHAFRNRCAHQASPIAGGWVRHGVLSCPQHFWRFDLHDGAQVGGRGCLDRLAIRLDEGVLSVELPDDLPDHLPDDGPTRSLREQLLVRARSYDRDVAWSERDFVPTVRTDPSTGCES